MLLLIFQYPLKPEQSHTTLSSLPATWCRPVMLRTAVNNHTTSTAYDLVLHTFWHFNNLTVVKEFYTHFTMWRRIWVWAAFVSTGDRASHPRFVSGEFWFRVAIAHLRVFSVLGKALSLVAGVDEGSRFVIQKGKSRCLNLASRFHE